jgi:hypothetical protein
MRHLQLTLLVALGCAMGSAGARSATPTASAPVTDPIIQIEDVERFYEVYNAEKAHPRNISGATIADALAKRPEIYSDAKRCLAVLPRVRERLKLALRTLVRLYPEARLRPVTIAVGRGRPVGITEAAGVMIGLEALCATDWLNPNVEDRFVHVIAHEYGHVQQALSAPELFDKKNPTVLDGSLIEGAAEFTAELISGDVAYYRFRTWTKGREKEIETAFVADEDKTDLSRWLSNGKGTSEWMGDLGYWVGYRIAKSYYQNAADKRQALREILEMTDPQELRARSGWYPGIQLH